MSTPAPKCTMCDGSGWIEYYEIDGMTIYSWQKPKRRKCRGPSHD